MSYNNKAQNYKYNGTITWIQIILLALMTLLLAILTNTQHFVKNLITLEIINLILTYSLIVLVPYNSSSIFLILFLVLALSGAVLAFSLAIHITSHLGAGSRATI